MVDMSCRTMVLIRHTCGKVIHRSDFNIIQWIHASIKIIEIQLTVLGIDIRKEVAIERQADTAAG